MQLKDPQLFFKAGYLTMLAVSRLNSTGDMTINDYGAAGGMRIHNGLC
jgi:hypothetical protein